ncbi:nuclease-related domain-containing protein [Falsibacillus albus]|uniref:NERD domain-containing protein n=1 Tax=Falsibacillus albus TaxID=2478915 RepID=A0A3L7JVQ9_9BACI|nr:nuclease-related domain-containing protein [Falsibacillus albus]RLQ93751.1 NERD domain-containing protein [Falsibacillus albus]
MNIKPRKFPQYLNHLEALDRRLKANNQKSERVKEALRKRRAGFKGEKELDYHVELLPEKEYYILNDLRLFDGRQYFQIDTLIISRHCYNILEVKNISGILHFDPKLNQLIRVQDGVEEAFPYPLIQVDRQTYQLKKFLKLHNLPDLPVKSSVVIGNLRTIIKMTSHSNQIIEKIIHSAKVPLEILSLTKKIPKTLNDLQQLKRISKKICKLNVELQRNAREMMGIPISDILTGVQCTKCLGLPMNRLRGTWCCQLCGHHSKNAHIKALSDYLLLIDNKITNKETRDFLHIQSRTIAKKLLTSLNLPQIGTNKGRIYYLDHDIFTPFSK